MRFFGQVQHPDPGVLSAQPHRASIGDESFEDRVEFGVATSPREVTVIARRVEERNVELSDDCYSLERPQVLVVVCGRRQRGVTNDVAG